jgi:D-alanine-D-alanine ligase
VTTPRGFAADATIPQDELAKRIDRECGWPAIVKPNSAGSSVGFSILHAPDDLKAAVAAAAVYDTRLMFEEFIPGREMTVAVLADRALPVVEIVPDAGVYDYRSKYRRFSRCQMPANIRTRSRAMQSAVLPSIKSATSPSISVVAGEPILLPRSHHDPGMTPTSLVPKAAKVAGLEFDEIVERILRWRRRSRVRAPRYFGALRRLSGGRAPRGGAGPLERPGLEVSRS